MKHLQADGVAILSLLCWFTGITLTGCQDSAPTPTPSITPTAVLSTDSVWLLNTGMIHRVTVKITPGESGDGRTVTGIITGYGISASFRLADDGGLNKLIDAPAFADSASGDDDAHDGIFSRRLTSRWAATEGDYRLAVAVSGSPLIDTLVVTVKVRLNQPPEIHSITFPDSIHSGVKDLQFRTVISDPDGISDLASVKLIKYRTATTEMGYDMFRQNDSLWLYKNRPEIAQWLPTGWIEFRVRAQDTFGNQTESPLDSVWLENNPPAIVSVSGPDTVAVPPSDSIHFYYFVSVKDDQGFGDLDSLLLTISSEGRPPANFYYADNGDSAKFDSIAGDGRYTAWFKADSTSRRNVLFTFTWTPTDRTGQSGEPLQTTLVIVDDSTATESPKGERVVPRYFRNPVILH